MPIYESRGDRDAERMVRDWFRSEGFDAKVTKTLSRWDVEAQSKNKLLLVEVKRRKIQWGAYDTIFIDVSKVNALIAAAEERKASAVFVVVPNDMKPRFVMLSPSNIMKWKTNTIDVQKDRNDATDKGDLKYDIPLSDFRPLERA
jgi:Holliday junction resolvase